MSRRNTSPMRTIVAIESHYEHPGVLMDRLTCGHLLVHDGEADRQTRRRCHKCRLGRPAETLPRVSGEKDELA